MKVLTIKEPWASLIANGYKEYEFRSWKTNYRGELFIHASLSTKNNISNEVLDLIKDMKLNNGYIICKCKLVDCVYMTEDFINNIKNNNHIEYICGDYQLGRYAWILDDIEVVEPIEVKGKLGIWNY